jgi:uncharacterized membrane protein YdjX (TVP38/TMEM64 family)
VNRSTWIKFGIFCLVVVGIGLGLKAFGIDLTQITPEKVRRFVLSFGTFAPLVYLAVYAQPLVPLPAIVMTMTAGIAFGPVWGVPAALTGATLRACGQYVIAQLLGREAVEKLLKGRLAGLDQKIGQNSFQTVLMVRLIPNFPFDVQNYGLGFTQVRFAPYAIATFLGMIPGSFTYVYLGYSLTDLRNAWKVMVATLLIVGLVFGQRWYVKRRRMTAT